jgi:hypothetical protein
VSGKSLFCALIFLGSAAQARVFDINKESLAAYFLASGGSSALATKPIQNEGLPNLTYSDGINYNYTGEFGLVYSRPGASLRFGIEIIKPTSLTSTVSSTGTNYYSAESSLLGYAPMVTLDVNLHGNPVSRSFVSLGAGYASMTMKNDYKFTAAGSSAMGGLSDHDIETKGTGTLLQASLGYENILTDTTTIAVEFGYRQLKIDNFEYTKGVTTFGGAKNIGDSVKNADGSARALDFSGGFIALGFRFYL